MARNHKIRPAVSFRHLGRLDLQAGVRASGRPEWKNIENGLETLLLNTEDFELIVKLAKLLPVVRMAEQVRALTADFRADIAAKR